MEHQIRRFIRLGSTRSLAEALVAGGFHTPRQVKAASDAQLLALPNIGPATLAALRERFPPQ